VMPILAGISSRHDSAVALAEAVGQVGFGAAHLWFGPADGLPTVEDTSPDTDPCKCTWTHLHW
jgi:hypothetical protein